MNYLTCLLLALASATLVGCKREEIKVYTAPKEDKSTGKPMMAAINAQQPEVPVNAAPVSWTLPKAWKELDPTSMRLGNFQIPGQDGKQAEVAIMSFPGTTGSELDNWNRWRREVGLDSTTAADMKSDSVPLGEARAKLYDIPGAESHNVIAVMMREGASWFFKMRGDKDVVAANKAAFLEFLRSIRFEAGQAKPKDVVAAKRDPHAGLNLEGKVKQPTRLGGAEAVEGQDGPKWNVPATWQAKVAPPMVMKSFGVSGDDGQATVAISKFPGDVGGAHANVNRWRGQLGLAPVKADELPKFTTTVDAQAGKATFVDFTGTDNKTGKPARMVAAFIRVGEETWFYKMTGDDALVTKEKPAFTEFVKTVQY